jgi:hypothetical protein
MCSSAASSGSRRLEPSSAVTREPSRDAGVLVTSQRVTSDASNRVNVGSMGVQQVLTVDVEPR